MQSLTNSYLLHMVAKLHCNNFFNTTNNTNNHTSILKLINNS